MVARRLALPLALALVTVAPNASAWAAELTLDGFVGEVLARNPSLKAQVLRRGAFHEEAKAAGAYPDPALSVMLDRVPMGAEMPMIRYQLSQMLPWPGKLDLARGAVERQGDASAAQLETRRLDLRLDAKRGWYMLVLNKKRREVNLAGRDLAATIAAAALGRYGAGTGDHHEVARAEVEVSALDVELLNLEGEHTSIVAMLNALRDRPTDAAIPEPTDPPARPANEALAKLVDQAVEQRPELKEMEAMRGEALTMARMARKEPLPDLMVSAWVNQNIGAAPSFGVMLGGTVPLFGVAKQRHRAAAFDARAEGAAQDQAAMRAMVRFEVTDASVKMQTASRRLSLLRTVALPKSRESFEASLAGYSAGRVEIVGLLDARRALQAAELAAVEAEALRATAIAELERAVGAPLSGGDR
jgi:outer membrane protein, heavy metal efflux system